MKQTTYELDIHASPQHVYDTLRNVDRWAHLAPNYDHHAKIDERTSHWVMHGILPTKKIEADVTFVKEQRPTVLAFVLRGNNEHFTIQGQVILTPNGHNTHMFVQIKGQAEGMSAVLLNPLMQAALPSVTKKLAHRLAEKMEQTA
ncbi:MAG: SRPBCC family protein [Caryophanon sp.]|nr:SRPBCC family protein [Caryophanon sp.]